MFGTIENLFRPIIESSVKENLSLFKKKKKKKKKTTSPTTTAPTTCPRRLAKASSPRAPGSLHWDSGAPYRVRRWQTR